MTDTDLFIHRYLDQELSLEERVQFVSRLARDTAFRDRVLALEQLALEAGRLPRPIAPAAFVARVVDRAMPERSIWQRLGEVLVSPRTLRWNLAGVAAAALVAVLGTAIFVLGGSSPNGTTETAEAPAEIAAPAKVLVRLVVVQAGAKSVQVAGDFNGWDPSVTPLEPLAGGAWAVTIALEPGRYEYMFVVNGREWVADPFAVERSDDGFGSQNAVLDVRAPAGSV